MSDTATSGLEWATARGMGALAQKMGMEFTEFGLERCVATMPVEGNTQPVGLMHGGAYVVLGESLG
ncbi:MAG: thioesterase, partial [Microbacterium sp.]